MKTMMNGMNDYSSDFVILNLKMKAGHSVQDYERRLQQIPKHNKELQDEIRNMQDLVGDQCNQFFKQRMTSILKMLK